MIATADIAGRQPAVLMQMCQGDRLIVVIDLRLASTNEFAARW
jgi:hypothetical protein